MSRSRTLIAGPVACAVLGLALSSTPAASQVPGVSVPSVTTPVGSTPSVSLPDVGVAAPAPPSAPAPAPAPAPTLTPTVPSVTVPPIQAPSVQTPSGSTPSTTTPSVQTPSVTASPSRPPSVSAPSVGTPSVSAPTVSGGSGSVPTPTILSRNAPAGSPAPATPAGTAGDLSAGAAGNLSAASASTADDIAAAAGETPGTTPSERARALRRAVLALQGCLAGLPAPERLVLELRAGVGIDHPRTRRRVADLTKLAPATVKRLERSGLRRLHALHRGGCDTASAPSGAAGAAGALATTSTLGPGAGAVLGERERSSGQSERGDAGSRSPGSAPLAKAGDGGGKAVPDLSLLLIPIVVLGFLMFAARELRRTLNRV